MGGRTAERSGVDVDGKSVCMSGASSVSTTLSGDTFTPQQAVRWMSGNAGSRERADQCRLRFRGAVRVEDRGSRHLGFLEKVSESRLRCRTAPDHSVVMKRAVGDRL